MAATPQLESIIEYVHRDMKDGTFWLDIVVDRVRWGAIGPFDSDAARQRAHDDLMTEMRALGARDLPTAMQ